MKITEETMIFKNDIGYSTSISKKNEDGTYENMFIPVNFKKGIEVENKTKINILNGFLSFYKTKEGLTKIKLVVTEFTAEDKQEEMFIPNNAEITDDLPF